MTARQILARVLVGLAIAAAVVAFLPHDWTIMVARAVALVTIVHLMWRYHRLADWSAVEIGRSTMAIKGSILLIAVAANLRSLDYFTDVNLSGLSEGSIIVGWLAMSAALIHRDQLVARMQGEAHALPAPPPKHYLPSEEIKDQP